MRIGVGKRVGGIYVGASTSSKKLGKGCLSIIMFPITLVYYICICPFIALYRKLTGKTKVNKAKATALAPQYLKIIKDCAALVNETKRPDVFFERFDLLTDTLTKLADIEKIAPLSGDKPSVTLSRVLQNKGASTDDFIDRYAKDTRIKIHELSSAKAKANKAEAFRNILHEYDDKMDESNVKHYTDLYRQLKALSEED